VTAIWSIWHKGSGYSHWNCHPIGPVIAILENGARIFIGVEGGIVSMTAIATPDIYRCYWHQMF
jgi:hypothetical protein